MTAMTNTAVKVAIILPVLNEGPVIRDTIKHLLTLEADELLVVDGSSEDDTLSIIRNEFPQVRVFQTMEKDRALQMNLGAFESQSHVFFFVHSDMQIPITAIEIIRRKIERGYVGGGFRKCYVTGNWMLKIYCQMTHLFYYCCARSLVGTNGIFVRRDVFERIGGYKQGSFMEDVVFSDKLKKEGRIALMGESILVSARRYETKGVLRQIIKNIVILFRYKILHQDPIILREMY